MFLEAIQMSELEPIIYIYIYWSKSARFFPSCCRVTKDDIYFADAGVCWRLGLPILVVFLQRLLKFKTNQIRKQD